MSGISKPQMRKIYATARDLGIDNELLHEYVLNATGSESISALSAREACLVIDGLGSHEKLKNGDGAPGKVYKGQQGYIQLLAEKLGWKDNPKRLQGFVKKYTGVEQVAWLTPKQASNVIEGLKKLLERQRQRGQADETREKADQKPEAAH